MGRHHFFAAPDEMTDDTVVLSGDEAHHAARALRVRAGEVISVADGSGKVVEAAVVRTASNTVTARILRVHEHTVETPQLVVCQAVAKKDRMDYVVQKAVELGARTIVPYLATRSIVRWDRDKMHKARDRWAAVALSAAKQSRSPWRTEVRPVAPSAQDVAEAAELVLVLDQTGKRLLRDALPQRPPQTVAVCVGPEGGLEEAEVGALEAAGAVSVTLGQRILRTETAAPVALALVSFAYGNLG